MCCCLRTPHRLGCSVVCHLDRSACTQELAERDSLEDGPLLNGATFHNLARQCRLEPRWHEQVASAHVICSQTP